MTKALIYKTNQQKLLTKSTNIIKKRGRFKQFLQGFVQLKMNLTNF